MLPESRAEYFRQLRRRKKQMVFLLDNDKADALDRVLKTRGEGRTAWFRRKVDEELNEKDK